MTLRMRLAPAGASSFFLLPARRHRTRPQLWSWLCDEGACQEQPYGPPQRAAMGPCIPGWPVMCQTPCPEDGACHGTQQPYALHVGM